MKLNLQRSPLYIYMLFNNYDGFKILPVFEDMDETDLKYNVNCEKMPIKYYIVGSVITKRNAKSLKKSFYTEHFRNDK